MRNEFVGVVRTVYLKENVGGRCKFGIKDAIVFLMCVSRSASVSAMLTELMILVKQSPYKSKLSDGKSHK